MDYYSNNRNSCNHNTCSTHCNTINYVYVSLLIIIIAHAAMPPSPQGFQLPGIIGTHWPARFGTRKKLLEMILLTINDNLLLFINLTACDCIHYFLKSLDVAAILLDSSLILLILFQETTQCLLCNFTYLWHQFLMR